MTAADRPLLELKDLVKDYRASSGLFAKADTLRAVNHVSLSIEKGESLGLVGESGSGKTTLGRCSYEDAAKKNSNRDRHGVPRPLRVR